jgi:hypothetical protein
MTATAAAELNRLEDSPEPMLPKSKYVTIADAIAEANRRGMNSFNYGRLWMVKNKTTGEWKGFGGSTPTN